MTYHNKEKQEVLQELNVQEATGLSSSEVKKRREQYGENRLRAKKSKSNWERFAEQFKDVMILILLAAAAISFVVACVEGDPEGFFEPLLILLIVVVNAIMGVMQESRAEKALEALKSMSAPHARVLRDKAESIIDASELVPGDIIRLEAGDFVPADARLLQSVSLKSEESALTGESVPAEKDAGACPKADAPLGVLNCRSNGSGGNWVELNDKRYYMVLEPLQVYNRNAPFAAEKWFLAGTMEQSVLLAFSSRVREVLLATILLTLVLSVLGSLLVSARLARPINRLYREVIDAQEKKTFPRLSRTAIREVDRFAETITELNKELVTNSTKFLRIMDMASVEIGGYELRTDTGSVFVTDNFFSLLGKPEMQGEPLSVRRFEEVLKGIREKNPRDHTAEGDELLTIQQPDGVRYIMLRSTIEGHAKIGLAEDVTAAVLERKRIEHERDHDILTGLYNRQAFNRVCTELFAAPERMGVAALMMMDLDNLKHINDTYGHDWGDQYIRRTGQCLRDNTPAGTVCARLSGDEFLVLFHGYRSRDAVREKIDRLTNAMRQSVALLPSGNALHISLSGGIAWYPDDGQDWETLKKYADFAMYQVKHSEKGRVEEFDIGVYNREAYAERTRREFRQLLSNAQVFYCFQPIFSARSGRVVAYEALMRSDLPTLRSPATIMKLAREQGALYEIERLTFTKALETFDSLCRAGSVSGDAMLFVNSIASTCLTQADVDYIDSRWHELRRRMVIEITEEEAIDREALERKRNDPGSSGMFALDDYGSGYSNENSLLELAPRFIKVDIAIIRGIDTSPDKQQILRNVVAYAHPRSMKIVAEGVETAAELRTVIELGADLLQGYFLARPAIAPGDIAPEAAGIIQELQRRKKD